jgi:hypothetical protein
MHGIYINLGNKGTPDIIKDIPVLENITKLQFIALNRNVHTIGSKSSENLA